MVAVIVLAVAGVAAVVVLVDRGPDGQGDGPPDLVLLLAVGLRADLGEPGGGPLADTAYLEALGLQPSVRFTQAYAQSTSPHASLAALWTGLYPSAIPLCGHKGKGLLAEGPDDQLWCSQVPPDRHTLPELLATYGYATRVQMAGESVGVDPGEAPGAASDGGRTPWGVSSTDGLSGDAAAWWDAHAGQPRLLVVVDTGVFDLRLEHEPHREPPREQLYAAYRDRARAVGARHAGLIASLEGGARPAWIVATSPNGLNLAERSGSDDGYLDTMMQITVAERTAHVPLVLSGPIRGRREVGQIVELVDLLPTLLGIAGVPPPIGLPGEDLLALRGEGDPASTAYVEFGDSLALRRGDHLLTFRYHWHNASSLDPVLTWELVGSTVAGGDDECPFKLHDVTRDPLQTTDLRMEQLALARELRSSMLELRQGEASPPPGVMDPEQVETLRAFQMGGYW